MTNKNKLTSISGGEDDMSKAIADSFNEDSDGQLEVPGSEQTKDEASKPEFVPFITRSSNTEARGLTYIVTNRTEVHYQEDKKPHVKESVFLYEKLADAITMSKAFLSSSERRVSEKVAETAARIQLEKEMLNGVTSKQISFLETL